MIYTNIKVAKDIKIKNNLDAPINDISDYIKNIKESGISERSVIEKMVREEFSTNSCRQPKSDEILLYNLNDEYIDLITES